MNDRLPRYDAVIVGARCAGAATAMLLARNGQRVLAIDRASYGRDTLSTHALMRGGVLQLTRWGLIERLAAAGTPAVHHTAFHYGDDVIDIKIKPRDGIEALYAPRRTVLDALLVDAAREAGAEVRFGTRLRELQRDARGAVTGVVIENADGTAETIAAGIVIGADGMRSTVARMVGAQSYRTARHATGVVYGYFNGLDYDGFHWYFRPGISAGAIPTNDGDTCVFAAVPSNGFDETFGQGTTRGYLDVLERCDVTLATAVRRSRQVGSFFSFSGVAGYMRQSWGPGWTLVGDAGYFKDPLTAHGITDALRDAELLARAVIAGGASALAAYQTKRDELALDLFDVTDDVASFDWDLERVKQLHLTLSKQMNHEVDAMTHLGPVLRRSA